MIRHSAKGKKKIEIGAFALGLNEMKPVTEVGIAEAIRFENARVSIDGSFFEKRKGGLEKIDALYNFGGKKILGFESLGGATEVRLVVCTEDKIWLKTAGAWTTIFTPTQAATKPLSLAKYRDLLYIAGYEKPIVVIGNLAYYAGVGKPASAPTLTAQAATTTVKVGEHAFTNQDYGPRLRATNDNVLFAQSFMPASAIEISGVKLSLKKIGSPSGNVWVEIHSSQVGTSATKNASTNIVGQGSDNIACSTLSGSYSTQTFSFSGTKPSLAKDTIYYIVVYGDFSVSASAYVLVGADMSSSNFSVGKGWTINSSFAWTAEEDLDVVFEILGTGTATGTVEEFGPLESGWAEGLRKDGYSALLAQSFKVDAATDVSSVKIALRKVIGDEAFFGNVWAEIHSSQTGTDFTKGISASIVGGASDSISVANISEGFAWVEFIFSGMKPALAAATTYYLVLFGDFNWTEDHYIDWTYLIGYDDGQAWKINAYLEWSGQAVDLSFKIIGTYVTTTTLMQYALANLDDPGELRDAAARTIMAQSFKLSRSGSLSSIKLKLAKVGAPTGNIWVEIHKAQGGTSLTKNASTNIVGQGSDDLDVSTISAFPTYTEYTLSFSGTKPSLAGDYQYFLVVYASYTISASALIFTAMSTIGSNYGDGECWYINASLAWTKQDYIDICFEAYYLGAASPGVFKYVVTFLRSGNYPCEGNPSEESLTVPAAAGQEISITNIPVSSEPSVDKKRLYRTTAGGAIFYFLEEIDNATTSYLDQHLDSELGDEVEYDNDPPPPSDELEIFDGRVWYVGKGEWAEYVYCCKADYPENFPDYNFYPFKDASSTKEVSPVRKIKNFNNELYVLKSNCIKSISRYGEDTYRINDIMAGTGTDAPASVIDTGEMLLFLSNHKGIEALLKSNTFLYPRPSDKVKSTLSSIDYKYIGLSTAAHYAKNTEYLIAIPADGSAENGKLISFNYVTGKIAVDQYGGNMGFLGMINPELSKSFLAVGSQYGNLSLLDEAELDDNGRSIMMDVQSGWLAFPEHTVIRRIYIEYILGPEASKKIYFKIYSNFRQSPVLEVYLPSLATLDDLDKRDVQRRRIDAAARGEFFSFRFLCPDNVTEAKVFKMTLYVRSKGLRRSIEAT